MALPQILKHRTAAGGAASPIAVVASNLITNGSVETDTSGWVVGGNTSTFDDFSSNTIASYKAGLGSAANWSISGGVMNVSGASDQSLKLDAAGLTTDFTVTTKVNLGATVPDYFGFSIETRASNNPNILFIKHATGPTMRLYSATGWTGWGGDQQTSFTPSANTSYWLQVRRSGTAITGKVFTVDPIVNSGATPLITLTSSAPSGTEMRPALYAYNSNVSNITFDDFRVDANTVTVTQSSAWAAAGTKSARFQATVVTGGTATLDTPSFAVTAGQTYMVQLQFNAATISAGNIGMTVHWSDGTTTAMKTITATGVDYGFASVVAPAGVTSGTIRIAPSTAGTFDISVDNAIAGQ